jgi:RNA polymerase sigma factor (sigma-70 family)
MVSQQDKFLPTRQSLLSRLRDWSDHDSWQEFFDTYWKLIYHTAIKAGLSEVEAQEVVQETVISVSKSMPGFRYDPKIGSFKKWLLNLTRWRIRDQLRKRKPNWVKENRGQANRDGTTVIERIADPNSLIPSAVWDEEWEKNLMGAAIEQAKRLVDPKLFQIFELYVFQDWPVKKIAKTFKVSAAKIYLAKHRIAKLIKKELEQIKVKTCAGR